MAQATDFTLSDQPGATFRQELNTIISALVTANSGSAEPGTTQAFMLWADTTTNLLKIRNAANSAWVVWGTLDNAGLFWQVGAGAPGGSGDFDGQPYWDTTNNALYTWDTGGAAWVQPAHVTSTSNPHSVTAAQISALALAGGTMTGPVTLPGDVTGDLEAVPLQQIKARINRHAWKIPVLVASTANIDLGTGGLLTVDGVSLSAGNRVLVKDQTAGAENGLYLAASGAWARATDADTDADVVDGMAVFVTQGTAHGDTLWTVNTADPITVGTTAITFAELGAGAVFTKSYASPAQTITSGGQLTLAHGLGAVPKMVRAYVKCTTAEINYSVGDTVEVPFNQSTRGASSSKGLAIRWEAANLVIRMGSAATVFDILNASTGGNSAITNSKWDLYLEAYA